MSMTENEAKKYIRSRICNEKGIQRFCRDNCMYGEGQCAFHIAIKALEEIQQYRAIGTVKGYERAIQSSIENYNLYREYKAKVQEFEEKMQDVEITIINRMQEFYDEYRSISQSKVDHFGGKADAIETSQKIVKGVFKDVLGIDWQ